MGGVKQCEDFGKVCAYGLYIAGGSVVIGLARLVVSVAKLAINFFTSQCQEKSYKAARNEADNGDILDQAAGIFMRVGHKVTKSTKETERAQWGDQAARGLIEMIPIVGAAYFTHQDWSHSKKVIPMNKVFGWDKFSSAMREGILSVHV